MYSNNELKNQSCRSSADADCDSSFFILKQQDSGEAVCNLLLRPAVWFLLLVLFAFNNAPASGAAVLDCCANRFDCEAYN